jgi:hypothetical protein
MISITTPTTTDKHHQTSATIIPLGKYDKYYKNDKKDKYLENAIFPFGGAASWGGRV